MRKSRLSMTTSSIALVLVSNLSSKIESEIMIATERNKTFGGKNDENWKNSKKNSRVKNR